MKYIFLSLFLFNSFLFSATCYNNNGSSFSCSSSECSKFYNFDNNIYLIKTGIARYYSYLDSGNTLPTSYVTFNNGYFFDVSDIRQFNLYNSILHSLSNYQSHGISYSVYSKNAYDIYSYCGTNLSLYDAVVPIPTSSGINIKGLILYAKIRNLIYYGNQND